MAEISSSELLKRMMLPDLASLAHHLGVHGTKGNPHSKDYFITAIAPLLDDPKWVEATFQGLDMKARLSLVRWLWSYRFAARYYMGVYIPEWKAYFDGLHEMARTGLILEESRTYGLSDYHLPPVAEEYIRRWSVTLYAQGSTPNTLAGDQALKAFTPGRGPTVVTELIRILGALHRRPARLTRKGTLYKKDAEALDALFHPLGPREISPALAALEEGFTIPEDAVTGLVAPHLTRLETSLQILQEADLLHDDGDALTAVPGWEEWFQGGLEATWFNVVDIASGILRAHCPQITDILTVLSGDAVWFKPAPFFRDVIDLYTDGREILTVGLGVRAAWWLGLIDAGLAHGAGAIRLNGEAKAMLAQDDGTVPSDLAFIVQPSGEVLAPARLDPFVQARLEQVADLERVDTVSTYRLSQTRIWAELERGTDKQAILAVLHEGSKGGLPQAVAYELEGWITGYSRVAFAELTALYCEEEELLTRLLAIPAAARFLVGRLGPHHAIVREGRVESLRRALAAAGFHVARRTDHPGAVTDIEAPHADRRKLDDMIRDLVNHLTASDQRSRE